MIKKIFKFLSLLTILVFTLFFFIANKDYFFHKEEKDEKVELVDQSKKVLDKAFIINLDHQPQRFQRTRKRLIENGLKDTEIERFSAVYGIKINIFDYSTKQTFTGQDLKDGKYKPEYGNKYKINCSKDFYFDYTYQDDPYFLEGRRFFTSGELGCTCSHLLILKESIKRNYDNILIFEDDVVAIKKDINIKNELKKIRSNLPKDFEMIILGNQLRRYRNSIVKEAIDMLRIDKKISLNPIERLGKKYNLFQGTFSLYFSKNGMKAFFDKSKTQKTLATDILYSKISIEGKKTYFVNPPLYFQYLDEGSSTSVGFNNKCKNFPFLFILKSERNANHIDGKYFTKDSEFEKNHKIINYEKLKNIKIECDDRVIDLDDVNESLTNVSYKTCKIHCSKSIRFSYNNKNVIYRILNNKPAIKKFCSSLLVINNLKNEQAFDKCNNSFIFVDDDKIDTDMNIDYLVNNITLFKYTALYDDSFLVSYFEKEIFFLFDTKNKDNLFWNFEKKIVYKSDIIEAINESICYILKEKYTDKKMLTTKSNKCLYYNLSNK